jgi:MFS transporter, ACS family, solute carrier family 17 (sodium-dependent inorganic phosphate cotransporter), other
LLMLGYLGFRFPQRILLAVMAFLGFMSEYMMRNLLSIAITQIAKKTFVNESIISGEVCPADNDTFPDNEDVITEGTYEWSQALQGVILSSFYWGYIVTHVPGGMLVEKFGGKVALLAGIAATSVLTFLTPLSITLGGSTLLIINRIIMGLCQGFIYAAVFGLLATWIPLRERTTLGVFVLSGIQVNGASTFHIEKVFNYKFPVWLDSLDVLVWCIAAIHRRMALAFLHLQHSWTGLVFRIRKPLN